MSARTLPLLEVKNRLKVMVIQAAMPVDKDVLRVAEECVAYMGYGGVGMHCTPDMLKAALEEFPHLPADTITAVINAGLKARLAKFNSGRGQFGKPSANPARKRYQRRDHE